MDLQKSKLLLDKINALYNNMSADRNNVSIIEKDLMKSYIQQLYESFLEMPGQTVSRPAVEVIKSSPKVTLNKPVEKKEVQPPPKPAPEPEPIPEPEPEPEPIPEPPKQIVPPPPPPPEPPKPAPPKPDPVPVKPASTFAVSAELEELFAFNTAKELSEKLSEMPIKDIKKAMGLNERIFTVNELFGGDQAVFDLTVDTLNQFSDFQQAKSFLLRNAASKYHWDDKGKQSKAKNFIKLVKRRYS